MTQPAQNPASRGRLPRGWLLFAAVLAAIGVVVATDMLLVHRPRIQGYCPEGALCVVSATDLGRFWGRAERSGAVRRFTEEAPRPLSDFELEARLATGIRPTSGRWRVWMGRRFVWAHTGEASGICVYPGALLRVADVMRGAFGHRADNDGIREFGDRFYAWRDGFLLISRSRGYVAAALSNPVSAPGAPPDPGELHVRWPGPPEGDLTLRADDELTFEGALAVELTARRAPLTLPGAIPNAYTAAVVASKPQDLRALAEPCAMALRRTTAWRRLEPAARLLWDRWQLGALPSDWDRPIEECAAILWRIDTAETLPVPEVAAVMRCAQPVQGAHPLKPLVAPLNPMPYEWQEYPGLVAPLLGEKLAVCLGRSGRDWIAATQEPLMTEFVGRMTASTPVEADFVLRVDWLPLGEALERIVTEAGRLQLIPGLHPEEVAADYGGYARGLARMGVFEMTGRMENGRFLFEGRIARDREEAGP